MKKKTCQHIIEVLIFCALFVGCERFFYYILVDDTQSASRVMLHELHIERNIDVLFIGSSHAFRSFSPTIFNQKLDANTFNAGTSSQSLNDSYMILKEAAKYNKLNHVYLELFYYIAFLPSNKDKLEIQISRTWFVSDYLNPSFDKIQYLLDASSQKYYINSFIPATRNRAKIFNAKYIKDLIVRKNSPSYKNYGYDYLQYTKGVGLATYTKNGYIPSSVIIEDWNYFHSLSPFNIKNISKDWLRYLKKIITFCNENNIQLTLVSVPMPDYLVLTQLKNYYEYVALVKSLIVDTCVDYYDFNLCKSNYFPNTSYLFEDISHLNCYGADTFSRLLADFINGKIKQEDLFYDSYAKKLENLPPKVFGVNYHDGKNDTGEPIRTCEIITNKPDELEYEIVVYPREASPYKIQDFSSERFFTIPAKERGTISIVYRIKTAPHKIRSVDISYQ